MATAAGLEVGPALTVALIYYEFKLVSLEAETVKEWWERETTPEMETSTLGGEFEEPSLDPHRKMCVYSCTSGMHVIVIHRARSCPKTVTKPRYK